MYSRVYVIFLCWQRFDTVLDLTFVCWKSLCYKPAVPCDTCPAFRIYLTPWSRALPEKPSVPQLLNIFPAFYGNRKLNTAFTVDRHLSLPWARSIQSMPPSRPYFFKIHFNIILASMPRSSKWSLLLSFPHQNSVYTFSLSLSPP
jgi:hypothetical protein